MLRADAKHPNGELAVSGGQGTSFAVALTAGIAALWLAFHGRNSLIAKLPRKAARCNGYFAASLLPPRMCPDDFDRDNFGAGIVDALALLKADPSGPVAPAVRRVLRRLGREN